MVEKNIATSLEFTEFGIKWEVYVDEYRPEYMHLHI